MLRPELTRVDGFVHRELRPDNEWSNSTVDNPDSLFKRLEMSRGSSCCER